MGRTPPPFTGQISDRTTEEAVSSLRNYVQLLEGRVRQLERTTSVPLSYAMIALSADQSSNISVDDHWEFDKIARFGKSISLDGGIITLQRGGRYRISSHLAAYTNEGYFRCLWRYHPSDSTVTDDTGVIASNEIWLADPVALDASATCSDTILLTVENTVKIKLDIIQVSNGVSLQGASRVWIEEVSRAA